jgi:DeoR/GlpR family transcriptional regulator of sugar metabolism
MILQEIQQYLRQHPVSSLAELSQHFHSDPDALRLMLDRLQSKGRVRKLEAKKCGGCQSCAPETLELYEWINS